MESWGGEWSLGERVESGVEERSEWSLGEGSEWSLGMLCCSPW